MKKTLTFLGLMGAMATSAVAGTVAVAPTPAPTPAPVPAWEPAVGLEMLCAIGDQNGVPNMWGPRFSYSLLKAANEKVTHEVVAGLGLLWGSECDTGLNTRVFEMPLTVGYNYNYAVCDKTSVYAGAKLGLNYVDVNYRMDFGNGVGKESDATWGWQWSVGTGIKYELTQQMDLILGYEFTRVYADFYDTDNMAVGYHVINLGVQYSF
ncbi:MAG: outer membrane beta-barrel protein [Akkermansia sp.]